MFVFTGAAQETRLTDPADLPTLTSNGVRGLAFSGDKTKLAILSQTTTNSISIYDITQNPPVRVAVFSTPNNAIGIDWSRDGAFIAVSLNSSPGFALYDANNSFTKVPDSATAWPGTNSLCVAFNKESTRLFVSDEADTTIRVYSFSTTAITFLTTLKPTGVGNTGTNSMVVSEDGTLLAIGRSSTLVPIWTWTLSSAGTVFTEGGSPAASTFAPRDICISPDKTLIAIVGTVSPFVAVYNYPALTKRADPASLPSSFLDGCTFNPDGTELLLTGSLSGNLEGYTVSTMTKFTRALGMGPTIWRIKAMKR